MTSYRETSTQTECSRTELMRELLDLIEVSSQPEWGMSPIGTPPESELDSDSLIESNTESENSSEVYGRTRQSPGGRAPPLIPPP
uniref:ORF3 n=1 Tax=Torque teno Leptonychotes weddellii virus-1 TaxID=2012676 RepID=A0A1Z2RVC4_9VIRU|nr:ORF3 [Torque teno Leptonychotes weddellii virus 1]